MTFWVGMLNKSHIMRINPFGYYASNVSFIGQRGSGIPMIPDFSRFEPSWWTTSHVYRFPISSTPPLRLVTSRDGTDLLGGPCEYSS